MVTVCEGEVVSRHTIHGLDLVGLLETVAHEHIDASFLDQLKRAVLAFIRQVFGRQKLITRVNQRYCEFWSDKLELSGHLDTDGTSTDHDNAVASICDCVNVLLRLDDVLLAKKRLGDGRPDSTETGSSKEVVVAVDNSVLGDVNGRSGLGRGVYSSDAAVDKLDAGVLQGRNVVKLDPCLLGVFGVGESKRGTDQMVCGAKG